PRIARKSSRRAGIFFAAYFWAGDADALSHSLVVLLQLHRLSDGCAAGRAGAHLGWVGEFQRAGARSALLAFVLEYFLLCALRRASRHDRRADAGAAAEPESARAGVLSNDVLSPQHHAAHRHLRAVVSDPQPGSRIAQRISPCLR